MSRNVSYAVSNCLNFPYAAIIICMFMFFLYIYFYRCFKFWIWFRLLQRFTRASIKFFLQYGRFVVVSFFLENNLYIKGQKKLLKRQIVSSDYFTTMVEDVLQTGNQGESQGEYFGQINQGESQGACQVLSKVKKINHHFLWSILA